MDKNDLYSQRYIQPHWINIALWTAFFFVWNNQNGTKIHKCSRHSINRTDLIDKQVIKWELLVLLLAFHDFRSFFFEKVSRRRWLPFANAWHRPILTGETFKTDTFAALSHPLMADWPGFWLRKTSSKSVFMSRSQRIFPWVAHNRSHRNSPALKWIATRQIWTRAVKYSINSHAPMTFCTHSIDGDMLGPDNTLNGSHL